MLVALGGAGLGIAASWWGGIRGLLQIAAVAGVCAGLGWLAVTRLAGIDLVALVVFVPGAVAAAAVDIEQHRLPNRLTLTCTAVLLGLYGYAAVQGHWQRALQALLIGAAVGLVLLVTARVSSLGMGDVKLGLALGLVWGWHGWPAVAAGTMIVAAVGFLVAVGLLLAGQQRSTHLAFGPILALGCLSALL